MVRCKRQAISSSNPSRPSSNSTVVRCKLTTLNDLATLSLGSNSTVVRCKPSTDMLALRPVLRSNSTVVRCKRSRCRSWATKCAVQIPPWFDANSYRIYYANWLLDGSNSTVVRCKPSFRSCRSVIAPGFKFHRGSMQTLSTTLLQFALKRSNSTVVRCKPVRTTRCRSPPHRSNSTVVRCKHERTRKGSGSRTGSNSTVVRCKHTTLLKMFFVHQAFKFHRGSMQTT